MEHATATNHTVTRMSDIMATSATLDHIELSDRAFTDCRQRLISYLVKLNQALDRDLTDLSQALLTRFCEALVDYLSAGHFNLFQRVVLAADEYAAIESTTQLAMTFNDRFADRLQIDVAEVKGALEHLAQVLGTRFELEDDSLLADRIRRH